jgi:TRAP-type C4-dicarboxylate transport system permease small subunit
VIARLFDRTIEWLCILLMVVLAVDLMLGVFSRYVLMSTFTWYDEVARVCFVWAVFLGAAVGVKRGAHFGLHIIIDMLPPRARRFAALVTPVMVILFSAVLIVEGWNFVDLGWFQQTPVMGLPKAWVYAAMPVGGVLMVLYSLAPLWRGVREAFA